MVSKFNRIASLVIFNYKIFMGETPLTRGGRTPSRALPHSCLRHSVNFDGVQWPYHFPKADDGPGLRLRVAVKLNFRPYIRRYTSPNENFEYSYMYPLNDKIQLTLLIEQETSITSITLMSAKILNTIKNFRIFVCVSTVELISILPAASSL